MKVTGIIAEYNPFHNGHRYHLEKAKELTDADYTVVIMSGDYTQRGTPAIFSKYVRAKAALLSGADLILEMPVFGSAASAPDFSECGVNSLHTAGICSSLFFGSESGNIESLCHQASALSKESPEISEKIRAGIRSGLSWPMARAAAYDETEVVAASPNDILGIEYIKALTKCHSSIRPVTVKRTDPGYHSKEKSDGFASASAARKAILENNLEFLTEILPDAMFDCLKEEPCPPVTFDDCSLLLCEKLLNMSYEEIRNISGMPKDLAGKLYKNRMEFHTASALAAGRKNRNYTYTRVNRCLLNLMLGITKEDVSVFKEYHSVPWLRILGFRKDAAPLLSELKRHASIPVITKTADASSILSGQALSLFEKHLKTAELYRLLSQLKTGQSMKNEYTRSIIIV